MLERTKIDGRGATVAYLSNDWAPVDKGGEDFIKVVFDDGRVVFAYPSQPAISDFDPDEPRDEKGRWAAIEGEARLRGAANRDKLKASASMWPLTFYHGTAEEAVASIKKLGLVPHYGQGGDAWWKHYGGSMQRLMVAPSTPGAKQINEERLGSVYITNDLDTAKAFANVASDVHGNMGAAVLKVIIPPDRIKDVVHDEVAAGMSAYRFHGKIEPQWISVAEQVGPWQEFPTKWHLRKPMGDADQPLVLYLTVLSDESEGVADFDPGEPRDDKGKWTTGEGIVAYHGSAADFDRFDMSHVMSGEGSLGGGYSSGSGYGTNEYGQGVYFAERRETAENYRQSIAGRGKGNLYEVRIHAKPEDFLDWDAPLSAQPQAVKEMIGARATPATPGRHLMMGWIGTGPKGAARLLKAGVPGVRYLDQGSRAAGHGTSNYVVFDPSIAEIKRKNDQPLDGARRHG